MTRCSQGPRRPSLGILLTHFVGRAEARKSVPLGRNKHCRRRGHPPQEHPNRSPASADTMVLGSLRTRRERHFPVENCAHHLDFPFCANVGVTEAAPFGLNKVLVWQSPSRNTDCQMCKGHPLRWLDYGQPNDAWSPVPVPIFWTNCPENRTGTLRDTPPPAQLRGAAIQLVARVTRTEGTVSSV